MSWTFHRNENPSDDLLCDRTPRFGRFYRPYAVYSPLLKKYVLWYKMLRNQAVAVSDTPEGPYTIHNPSVQISQFHGGGDHDVFIDDDGAGYLIYSGYPHYEIFVERLTPDYLDSTRIASHIPSEGHVEAPVMFKRNGIYYFMFGTNCNRGPKGSDLKVYTADHPMGPYHFRSNVNRDDNGEIIIKAQQNNVALIPTRTGVEYIWTAERWRSGKTPGWALGHSFQYWAPLRFEPNGDVSRFEWVDTWDLEIPQ